MVLDNVFPVMLDLTLVNPRGLISLDRDWLRYDMKCNSGH